jgi:lycopene beta-cyclase
MAEFDYVLVGGGLQNGLIAAALRERQPASRIALVERESALGGNHTWCFHEEDLAAGSRDWVEPFVVHRWPGYRVIFPNLERTLPGAYSAITSEHLHEVVSAAVGNGPGSKLFLNAEASEVCAHAVTLRSGERLEATVVIDARGPLPPSVPRREGYQKFLGFELDLTRPHALDRPVLMDAMVDQTEGYRFFYVLPLGPSRLLVEDTYFHDQPDLVPVELRRGILDYVAAAGWEIAGIVREETGVLPMPWAGAFAQPTPGPLVAGYRGGWFHPGTGYSFPVAARLAEFVAARPPEALFGRELGRFSRRHCRQVLVTQLLNRALFRWFAPASRIWVFERFYRLPAATIGNFYALRLAWHDCLRLVSGRPPRGLSMRYRLRSRGL